MFEVHSDAHRNRLYITLAGHLEGPEREKAIEAIMAEAAKLARGFDVVTDISALHATNQEGFKDLGYYIAEGYEGLIQRSRIEVQIGRRYFFQPRMCMLQWRHSGLVNYINRTDDGLQIRIEGLWIG